MDGEEEQLLGEVSPWVMSAYIYYTVLLCGKLMSNILLTTYTRIRTGIPPNPEDKMGKDSKSSTATHPDLIRVHRMHMNDLENIIPHIVLGLMYAMTFRGYKRGLWHFRIFFGARVLHSICHYFAIQPLRSLFWMIALCCNLSLAGHVMWKAGLSVKYF